MVSNATCQETFCLYINITVLTILLLPEILCALLPLVFNLVTFYSLSRECHTVSITIIAVLLRILWSLLSLDLSHLILQKRKFVPLLLRPRSNLKRNTEIKAKGLIKMLHFPPHLQFSSFPL